MSIVLLMALAGCFGPSTDGKDIMVVVNGLSFARTLSNEFLEAFDADVLYDANRDDYLGSSLSPELGSEYDVRTFGWSGDATETGEILAPEGEKSLRAFLRTAYGEARSQGSKFVVVAHSWGTFLSCLALSMESTGADPIQCDLFVTLSCPIAANHAGSITDPLDAIVEAYANAWMDDLGFDIGGQLYPHATRFLNYWAWGDCISGPLASRAPAAAKVKDLQIDVFGVEDATSLKRGTDDVAFWHELTTLSPSVATLTDYAASEGFGEDLPTLVSYFREEVEGEISRAGTRWIKSYAPTRLRLSIDSVYCVAEPEWGNSEFYGFFRIKRDGNAICTRKWYENGLLGGIGDEVCAWMNQGDSEDVRWSRDITAVNRVPMALTLDAALWEDDLGGDGPSGTGSAAFSFDGGNWVVPATSGSFTCDWRDGDDEHNIMQVNWSASVVEE